MKLNFDLKAYEDHIVYDADGKSIGIRGNTTNYNCSSGVGLTGVTPFPYIGDPLPNLNPPTVTIGTGTTSPYYPPVNTIPAIPQLQTSWTFNPLGAIGDFLNIQYLSVEAVCAVTGARLKPGEPVLILDEHIISKAAFMKMLRKEFERMMVPQIEEMHEMTGWNS